MNPSTIAEFGFRLGLTALKLGGDVAGPIAIGYADIFRPVPAIVQSANLPVGEMFIRLNDGFHPVTGSGTTRSCDSTPLEGPVLQFDELINEGKNAGTGVVVRRQSVKSNGYDGCNGWNNGVDTISVGPTIR